MSERRDPTDEPTHDEIERDEQSAFATSLRAALVEWERASVPALPSDFADQIMLEAVAHERASQWEAAFVPALPEGFAQLVATAAIAADTNRAAMEAWETSVPALPEDFAQSVVNAAMADEQSLEQSRRAAMKEWADAYVPALPESFAQSVADSAMCAEDAPRASGIVEKVVPIAPKVAAKRRWLAPAALSSIAAAAAVAVLALSGGPKPHTQPNGQHPATHGNTPHPQTNGAQPSQSTTASNANGSNPSQVQPTVNSATPEDGSEVEKVEVDGDRASFTAFSIAGEDDHGAVAVVWIEDGTKNSSAQ